MNLPNVLYACLWGAQKSPGAPLGPSKSGKKRLGVGRIMPNLAIHLAQGTQACPETLQGTLHKRLEAPRSMARNTQPYYTLGKGIFRNNKWLAASPLIRRDCPLEWKKTLRAGTHDDDVFRAGLPPQRPSKSDLVDTAWRHANGHVENTKRAVGAEQSGPP